MSTIIQQGRFTSDGTSKLIDLRSDVDWMDVYNSTVADNDAQTTAVGVQFYWQRGMADGSGIEYKKSDAANAAQLTTLLSSGGFTLLDPANIPLLSAPVTGTTITTAAPPVCTANNHGFSNGDQVLLSVLTNMRQLANVIWTIGGVTTNTFELSFMDTNTANFTAETAFQVRRVSPFSWNNGYNFISAITKGNTTSVQFSSNDPSASFEVDDVLNFQVGSEFGMTEINGLDGKILSFTAATNTYVVDINSSSFTDFAWPTSGTVPFTHPQAQLVGTVSTQVVGATRNEDAIQMKLESGIDSPAGSNNDIIFWRAGKSFSVLNE